MLSLVLVVSLCMEDAQQTGAGTTNKPCGVTLLVPGIAWDGPQSQNREADSSHETRKNWVTLIEYLKNQGHSFGGHIRPHGARIRLPECLEIAKEGLDDPRSATLFVMEFSPAANSDGLAFRALELAECLKELHRYTERPVRIVAHSAGGLVARVVLQRACPGIHYDGEADRLITIGTPHLGTALATNFGSMLGLHVSSLRPDAELIHRLNTMELPIDCCYTSVVIRGICDGARGEGLAYDRFIDPELRTSIDDLPIDYRCGSDEVVHVRAANLRFTDCARKYEAASARAVQSIIVRVPPPTKSGLFSGRTIHVAALDHPSVHEWVNQLLVDDAEFWTGARADRLERWIHCQAESAAFSAIESHVLQTNRLREVTAVDVQSLERDNETAEARCYRFAGIARSRGFVAHETAVEGRLELTFDRFGRVVTTRYQVTKATER